MSGCSRCNQRVVNRALQRLQATTPKKISLPQPKELIDLSHNNTGFAELNVSSPAIRNASMMPPMGGWGVTLMVKGRKVYYNGAPKQMVQRIVADYKVLATVDVPVMKVWNYLNSVWISRDPSRALKAKPTSEPTLVNDSHLTNSVDISGPYLWTMLSVFGKPGMFHKENFLGAIDYLMSLFSGDTALRCEQCIESLTKWRISHPPGEVENSSAAAGWVFGLHNEVNVLLGKPPLDFSEAVVKHGWDISLTPTDS